MTIWDCRTHVRVTSMTSSVERTDLDFKISVALAWMKTIVLAVCIVHILSVLFRTSELQCPGAFFRINMVSFFFQSD